jgi:hypothetical protein
MTIVALLFDLMGKYIPNELILKIIYHYRCVQHPIVTLLLESTKKLEYENNQKHSLGKQLQKSYEMHGSSSQLQELIDYFYKTQLTGYGLRNDYFKINDPGYFIKRPFGKLYYNIKEENEPVQKGKKLCQWDLQRSSKIIKNLNCGCGYNYYNVNHSYVIRESKKHTFINYNSDTSRLLFLEKKFNLNCKHSNYVCKTCQNCIDEIQLIQNLHMLF